jgi:glycosyltransferase involved in cell wall biosynthesis
MRIGQNPNKSEHRINIPGVVMGVITHLPNFVGYHSERFEVVKLSLLSMRERAGCKADTLIWDNGSCKELRDWLIDEYKPTTLILSDNVGKNNAKTAILRMFRDDTVVGIADDDIYYYPGWLKESIKLLQGFPSVGVVSAYPVRTQFRWGCKNTIEWSIKNGTVTKGHIMPDQWGKDFCSSIGRPWDGNNPKDHDFVVEYKGMKAFLTGHHCQFIGRAGTLSKFPDWQPFALSPERDFDNMVDNAKLLRLTTIERLARHMGNTIDEDITLDWERDHDKRN